MAVETSTALQQRALVLSAVQTQHWQEKQCKFGENRICQNTFWQTVLPKSDKLLWNSFKVLKKGLETVELQLTAFQKGSFKNKGSAEPPQSSIPVLSSQGCFHQLLQKVNSQNSCGKRCTVLTRSDLQQVNFAIPKLLQKQSWAPGPLWSSITSVLSLGSSLWLHWVVCLTAYTRVAFLQQEHLQQWHAALTSQILGPCPQFPIHIERQGMYWLVRTQTLLQLLRFKLSMYYFYLQAPSSSCP